jgi:ABC-type lipoprotein export system ATPase subunit
MELLTRLSRETQMTTLMVTHSQEIARSADRVLMIQDGQLVAASERQEAAL